MSLQEIAEKHKGVKVEKVVYHWDKTHKGFGLKLVVSGNHKWVQWKLIEGKRSFHTIGGLSLSYKEALKGFLKISHDKGALAVLRREREKRGSITLQEMVDEYFEREGKHKKSAEEIRWSLNRALQHLPRNLLVTDITIRDLENLRTKITSKAGFNQTIAYISIVWNKSIQWGLVPIANGIIPTNPCSFVKKYQLKPRSHFLDEKEFRRLWHAIDIDSNIFVKVAISLICLTGARKNEILSLKWNDIDFERNLLTFKDTKNGTDHVVRLTENMRIQLEQVPRMEEWVFPSDTKEGYLQSIVKPWKRMKDRAKIKQETTLQDLRRSVATFLFDQPDLKMEDVSGALNHKSTATTRRHYAIAQEKNKAKALAKMDDLFTPDRRLRIIKR